MRFLLCALCLISTTAFGQLPKSLNDASKLLTGGTSKPTEAEVMNGLKEALVQGISKGADLVSKPDGYFGNPQIKIPFPQDMKLVETKLRAIGLGSEVDRFVLTLNRGAEAAAKEAKPIFVNAIKQMTIQDAMNVLKGNQDAATQYLKRTTSNQLHDKFKPIIQQSLNNVNATKYYGDLVKKYNQIPFVQKVNPDLNEYATNMAMQGLFVMIASEEKKIRENPAARTTDLLKKVFGSISK